MCQACRDINELLRKKRDVDWVLKQMGYISKAEADDPFDLANLLQFEVDFADQLKANAKGPHEEAVSRLFSLIDEANLDRLRESRSALQDFQQQLALISKELGMEVTEKNLPVINEWVEDIYNKTKRRLADDLAITPSLKIRDRSAIGHLSRFQNFWLQNHYADDLATQAQNIVVNYGLQDGLGRNELGDILREKLGDKFQEYHYWDTVASTWLNNSRTYSSLNAMNQAGVAEYIYNAVLDERTTVICRSLDGMTFSVNVGLDLWGQVGELDDPEKMKDINPMINERLDSEGNVQSYYYKKSDGSTVNMRTGNFSRGYLESHGVIFPPVHFLCRSWIEAMI